jgi:hypothetical protein
MKKSSVGELDKAMRAKKDFAVSGGTPHDAR